MYLMMEPIRLEQGALFLSVNIPLVIFYPFLCVLLHLYSSHPFLLDLLLLYQY